MIVILLFAFLHLLVYIPCMKKKQFKSKGKEVVAVAQSPTASVSEKSAKGKQTAASPPDDVVTHLEFPPPEYLLQEAEKQPNRKLLVDYIETINVLRNGKGFSFREIAEWLTQNGVDADYNAVYRVYTKVMPDDEVAALDQEPADS
jgi:hypothetical protein